MAQIRDGKFAPLKIKLLWTALFFLCFMVGRYIPIPLLHNVAKGTGQANADLLDAANVASGGNFFYPSLFSLVIVGVIVGNAELACTSTRSPSTFVAGQARVAEDRW